MKFRIILITLFVLAVCVLYKNISAKLKFCNISFYYDANLNGQRDSAEPLLTRLKISSTGEFRPALNGSIDVPADRDIQLRITGTSPCGKALTTATHMEPAEVIMLPEFTYSAGGHDAMIGLADGYLTSPVRPGQLKMEDYSSVLRDPANWKKQTDPLFPAGWKYERNYFFYGYRIPSGGLEGTAHLAFDIWASPGTPVLASAPGIITEPMFDWCFGISGQYGTIYYNHIVPAVKIGDSVKRYDVVGYIAEGQGDHVHFELRPDPSYILEAFPGVGKSFLLKNPLKGEGVALLPFFGSE